MTAREVAPPRQYRVGPLSCLRRLLSAGELGDTLLLPQALLGQRDDGGDADSEGVSERAQGVEGDGPVRL
uniref:Uncharacterized protein n=1 Tax=Siphoviridae sp. ctksc2 TaxID=2825645 RepID=A0A8S5URT1_9CAUD|nr:MAG TPA: hypothetical protein [Siphoviridae sp. ctksc2]